MTVTYVKNASKMPETESASARAVVEKMLKAIAAGGETVVRDYALKLDGWSGDILSLPSPSPRLALLPALVRRPGATRVREV